MARILHPWTDICPGFPGIFFVARKKKLWLSRMRADHAALSN